MTTEYITTKDVAKLVRQALKDAFPGVQFSVRMSTGTASAWLNVSYTDGPIEEAVREVTRKFQGSQFNGMTDSYDRIDSTLVVAPGEEMPREVRYVCDGINTHRAISDDAAAFVLLEVERVRLRHVMSWQDREESTLEMRHGDTLWINDKSVPYYGGTLLEFARTAARRVDLTGFADAVAAPAAAVAPEVAPAASYTLEMGYRVGGVETIVTTTTRDGAPRRGATERITPAEFSNDSRAYAKLGITHLVERVTVTDAAPAVVKSSGAAELTITHTHEAGTLIEGTAKGDGSADALKAAGWRWSRNMGAWFVPQSRDRVAKSHVIDRTAAALRAAGFAVVVTIDATRRSTAEVEAGKIDRQADRVEALEAKAERKADADAAAWDRAKLANSRLPEGGEPIKVGHHSEGKHRAAIARSDRAMGASVEASRVAKDAADRAAAAAVTTDARYAPVTVANRIKKLGAEVRDRQRKLSGYSNQLGDVFPPASGNYAERTAADLADLTDQLAYWEGVRADQIAAGTATNYGPETIAKGDTVYAWHGWLEVARVNAKSVTVLVPMHAAYTAKHTVPYADLKGHRPAASVKE